MPDRAWRARPASVEFYFNYFLIYKVTLINVEGHSGICSFRI